MSFYSSLGNKVSFEIPFPSPISVSSSEKGTESGGDSSGKIKNITFLPFDPSCKKQKKKLLKAPWLCRRNPFISALYKKPFFYLSSVLRGFLTDYLVYSDSELCGVISLSPYLEEGKSILTYLFEEKIDTTSCAAEIVAAFLNHQSIFIGVSLRTLPKYTSILSESKLFDATYSPPIQTYLSGFKFRVSLSQYDFIKELLNRGLRVHKINADSFSFCYPSLEISLPITETMATITYAKKNNLCYVEELKGQHMDYLKDIGMESSALYKSYKQYFELKLFLKQTIKSRNNNLIIETVNMFK